MRAVCLAIGLVVSTHALAAPIAPEEIATCLTAAARVHHVPSDLLYAIVDVEAGRPGAVSRNTNGTIDIGPMQVNDTWLPQLMVHWSSSRQSAFLALRDSVCANFEAGAWILSQGFHETGDFWDAVARYHSHSGPEKERYLKLLIAEFDRMARRHGPAPKSSPQDNQD